MLVAFLQDFRGVETREQFFARGEEWDAPDDLALRLIHDGRAVAAAAKVTVRAGQSGHCASGRHPTGEGAAQATEGIAMAYTTLAAAKRVLGIDAADTTDDTLLNELLVEAQSAIELHCDRTFEAATLTKYYGSGSLRAQDLILDADLLSVTTLTNSDGSVLSGSSYSLWPRNSTPSTRIRLKSTATWYFADADSEISVLGSWGYSSTAPSCGGAGDEGVSALPLPLAGCAPGE